MYHVRGDTFVHLDMYCCRIFGTPGKIRTPVIVLQGYIYLEPPRANDNRDLSLDKQSCMGDSETRGTGPDCFCVVCIPILISRYLLGARKPTCRMFAKLGGLALTSRDIVMFLCSWEEPLGLRRCVPFSFRRPHPRRTTYSRCS